MECYDVTNEIEAKKSGLRIHDKVELTSKSSTKTWIIFTRIQELEPGVSTLRKDVKG